MTTTAPTLSQRLPTAQDLGGWKLAINPVALLFWLYLRRLFGCLDTMLADFAAGRLETAEPPAAPSNTLPRRRTHATRAPRSTPRASQAQPLPFTPATPARRSAQPRQAPPPTQDTPGRSQPRPNHPPPLRRRLE